MPPGSSNAAVSILLPTFNRAAFLPQALAGIVAQTCRDWELVIVDDGSTDDTPQVLAALRASVTQTVKYEWQPNAGAYKARNRALELASGRYIAFFDSDDGWMPQHLDACVRALDDNPDVDWVYAASRVVDYASGRVLDENSFRIDGRPRPFQALHSSARGRLRVIDDPRVVECALLQGLYCGLQNSVIRARVFETERFHTDYCEADGINASVSSSSSAEDQLFAIRFLKRGYRMGYIDDVHVLYRVHDENSSGSATAHRTVERQLLTYGPVARGLEELLREVSFTRRERRAFARRLGQEYFWHIGYAVYWMNGRRVDALKAFRTGLRYWPWSPRCWKTYGLAVMRAAWARKGRNTSSD
jgi:glycosyltransferase involved in cell wall biosynthesis